MGKVCDMNLPSPLLHSLADCGLERWIPPCRTLAYNFQSLEQIIELPADYPAVIIADAIADALSTQDETHKPDVLRQRLSQLPLFEYRVVANSDLWNPLHESLTDFRQRHDTPLRFWHERFRMPDTRQVSAWLDQWVG